MLIFEGGRVGVEAEFDFLSKITGDDARVISNFLLTQLHSAQQSILVQDVSVVRDILFIVPALRKETRSSDFRHVLINRTHADAL